MMPRTLSVKESVHGTTSEEFRFPDSFPISQTVKSECIPIYSHILRIDLEALEDLGK